MGDSVTSDPLRNRTLANILSELREFKTNKKKEDGEEKASQRGEKLRMLSYLFWMPKQSMLLVELQGYNAITLVK